MKTTNLLYRIYLSVFIVAASFAISGCKKFVDVGAPNSQLVSATVYINDATLKSALAGLFSQMANETSTNLQFNLSFVTGNSADEMKFYIPNETYDGFITNSIYDDNATVQGMWNSSYALIYKANLIIEGVQSSKEGLTDAMKKEAIAEAKFVRAYYYFYLTNLWGDVPLALSTNAVVNNTLFRSPKAEVYKQIIQDLIDARDGLQADYSYGAGERIKPNKYAAIALLARVYLYTGDYVNAQSNASTVISYTTLYNILPTASLTGIFVKNNTEAIFQLNSAAFVGFTQEGQTYAQGSTQVPMYQISDYLLNAFETGDKRFSSWVGKSTYQGVDYYYPSKYKQKVQNSTALAEYPTYLRLGEQYLIRAEAKVMQNDLDGAISDINVIRNRAGLLVTSAVAKADIILAIERERRIELFGECGHRWNDLRRTGRAGTVLGAIKPLWNENAVLYPIPRSERLNNNNLSQNKGY
ncbi:SusD family protein [compost metagenome]|uniref:RagB/SusD family nutrient uptake outer membrane protein n=1 Tax=Pedobacter sp. ok626 TaxID=1761882 RepID=UPI000888477D|nr:RagB/SusD family nutrient uptake outer membrane protein [Pedobacter sp. ok626]SDL14638.1 SusD family protein [Pedobacter sp. ok626]